MLRFLLLLLLVVLFLEASQSDTILKRADDYMRSATPTDTFRAYNDYKTLYLRSVVENDRELKLRSLRGIVKSGNILHIDVSKYSNELGELNKKSETYNKPQSKAMTKTKHIEDVHVKPLHKLKSALWRGGMLLLEFDKELKKEQINFFTLHDKSKSRYRYIFDIKESMLTDAHNISKNDIDRIGIAQFDPNTLRVVIEDSKEINISENISSFILEIEIKPAVLEKSPPISIIAPSISPKDKIIVIDAGHGGKDPGAVGYRKYREKIVVFKIAKELEKILKSRGYRVYMTRNKDSFIKLSERTKIANEKSANIFISIHANAIDGKSADSAQGIECYFLSPSRSDRAKKVAAKENSADISDMNMYGKDIFLNFLNHHNIVASNKLAIDLQRGMLQELSKKYQGVKDGGVREGPFWVLVGAQMPSVLVEVGFISHPEEAKRLVNNDYRKTMALGLANGIERYFANN